MEDGGNIWTAERVERLRILWAEGRTASQIAAEMGGVTRNAVIGKVHRLHLPGRVKSPVAAPARSRKTPARAPTRPLGAGRSRRPSVQGNTALAAEAPPGADPLPRPTPGPRDDVVVPMSERVGIMELRESMCRWPLGDPMKPEFRFCGARTNIGTPYCGHHARLAYQPAADRRRDQRLGR